MRTLPPLALVLALAACDGGAGVPDPGPGDVAADARTDATDDAGDPSPADTPPDAPTDVPADTPADPPADVPPDVPAPHPLFDYVGHVTVEEQADGGWSQLEARFLDAPDPLWLQRVDTAGDCELWSRRSEYPTSCTPECDGNHYCGPDQSCHPYARGVDAGLLAVEALGGPYAMSGEGAGFYYPIPEPATDLFDSATTVRVQATGATVPAFDVSLPGLAGLATDAVTPVALRDDADKVISWTPAGDGGRVEVVFQTGHHIPPPTTILFCSVPESAGQVVIAKSLIGGLADIGGPSLFPHPSFLRKVRRTTLPGPFGPVEVVLSVRQGVGIEHNPW